MNAQHEKTAALKSPAATGAEHPLSKETSETIAKNREKGNPQDAKSTYYSPVTMTGTIPTRWKLYP